MTTNWDADMREGKKFLALKNYETATEHFSIALQKMFVILLMKCLITGLRHSVTNSIRVLPKRITITVCRYSSTPEVKEVYLMNQKVTVHT